MPRPPKPSWHAPSQCYRTNAAKRWKYFRGIAKSDHVGIAQAFAAYMAELDAEARPPAPTATDLVLRFLKAARGIIERTRRSHEERLGRFLIFGDPPIGDRDAGALKAKDLREALRDWESEGLSDHYRAGICRSVKAAFAWAASEEGGRLIPANPFGEVKVPSVERAPERYSGRREVAAFLRFAWRRAGSSPPLYCRFGRLLCLMVRVAAHTGARPGELCAAFWEDLDPARRTLTLPPARHKTGRKTGRPRVIFLTPRLVAALLRERGRPGRHPVSIFTHKRGKGGVGRGAERNAGEPWGKFVDLPGGGTGFAADSTALAKALRKIRAEAVAEAERRKATHSRLWDLDRIRDSGDNRLVFYQLRHTTASDALMGGGNPATVAEMMGTSIKMLETTYSHLLHEHLAKAADELATNRRRKQ